MEVNFSAIMNGLLERELADSSALLRHEYSEERPARGDGVPVVQVTPPATQARGPFAAARREPKKPPHFLSVSSPERSLPCLSRPAPSGQPRSRAASGHTGGGGGERAPKWWKKSCDADQ